MRVTNLGVVYGSVFGLEVTVSMFSVQWHLKASKSSIPLFFRREGGLLSHFSLSQSTMYSSVTTLPTSVSLHFRFFFQNIPSFQTNKRFSLLQSTRTESITVIFSFWCPVVLVSGECDPFATVNSVGQHVEKRARVSSMLPIFLQRYVVQIICTTCLCY